MKRLTREAREAATLRIRGTRHNAEEYPQEYQHLTTLTSTLGKDVKFRAPAENRNTALEYARRRNLVLGPDEDVNNDQVNDVVLYDYTGKPVIVNGYELLPSESPYRIRFRNTYQTKKAKAEIGGYAGWKKKFHTLEGLPEWMDSLHEKYARIKVPKPRPATTASLYDYYSEIVRQPLLTTIDELLDNRHHLKSTFSIFNVIALAYLDTVIGYLWQHEGNAEAVELIKTKLPDTNDLVCTTQRYELFKSYIKKNQDKIKEQIVPHREEILRRSTDTGNNTILDILLKPVLNMVPGMPTDSDFALMKIAKEHDTLQSIRVQKAELSDDMKQHFAAIKSLLINRIFGGFDEADVATLDLSSPYGVRVRRYLDTLLSLDPINRVKHINALMRDKRHTHHLMSYMDTIKDPQYLPLWEEINNKLQRTGWLDV